MIIAESLFQEMINNTSREITGRVELLEGSSLLQTFTYHDALQSFSIERVGNNNKLFGYGICQKLSVKLRDTNRTININRGQRLDVSFGVGADYLYTTPVFFVDEVVRDENTNGLTITAYDAIYQAANYTVEDLRISTPYTILGFATALAAKLGMPLKIDGAVGNAFKTSYPQGGNFSGKETLREVMDDVAEVTGTIYFMDKDWNLVFKRLDISGNPVLTIDKSKYFTFSEKTKYTLGKITHSTELEDNVTIDSGVEGITQLIHENAFLTNRDDTHTLMSNLMSNVKGLTMSQFDLKWRGHFVLEIGDKIAMETKDGSLLYGYILNDKITYNGGLVETTSYSYSNKDSETNSNPVTLGEALKNTYAKVDKVNNEITLLASRITEERELTEERLAEFKITANEITQKVSKFETDINGVRTEFQTTLSLTENEFLTMITEQGNVVSSIKQDLDGINLTYNSSSGTASITIGDITVSNLVNGNYVEDAIAGINMTGYVTFNDLKNAGSTTINGSNITTGTISANRINLSGAVSWSDLSYSCQNTIASFAGDVDLPSYIYSTYIDSTTIYSPKIYGAELYAGTSTEGYIKMTSTGMNFTSKTGGNLVGIGYHAGYYNFPYIVFGQGVDDVGTDKGLIKKFENGLWIGDSDSINANNPSAYGVGIFIDFTNGKLYRYNGSGSRAELV